MGKEVVKARDLQELIEIYNPFAFKDEHKKIMVFKTYCEAYLELFDRIHSAGPKMVDAVLFCVDQYGMKLVDAQRFVNGWRFSVGQKDQFFLIDWKDGGKERDECLRIFARGLHQLTETKFNSDMFLHALELYKSKMNLN